MLFPGFISKKNLKSEFNLAFSILAINICIFVFSSLFFHNWPTPTSTEKFQNKNFDQTLAQMYLQTLDSVEKEDYQGFSFDQIATVAIKDHRFWNRVQDFPFVGDQIQIDEMKEFILSIKKDYLNSIQYQFGLGPEVSSPWSWITYQFTHFSFFHLVGNLIFIFFVVSYLEQSVSVFWIASVYLLGGIGGGVGFLLFTGIFNASSSMAMIGASGSLCALMSFLCVIKFKENMPWTYFFAPVPKGYGQIFLPVFFIFPIYLIADFTAMIWEPAGVSSSVAHSAHVGGTITGFVLGLYYLSQRLVRSESTAHRVFSDDDRLDKLF